MTQPKTSIVAAAHARALRALLPVDGTVGRLGPLPDGTGRQEVITLSARRAGSWWGPWRKRRWVNSGGIWMEARLKPATYGSASGAAWTRRLKPGWTEAQFLRAAAACHWDAWQGAHLQSYRENVYALFQPHEADTALTEAAEAAGLATGHSIVYDEMSQEDCLFWLDWAGPAFARFAAPGGAR